MKDRPPLAESNLTDEDRIEQAGLRYLRVLARKEIRSRNHRTPTEKQVSTWTAKWIEDGVLIRMILRQVDLYAEKNDDWKPSDLAIALEKYFDRLCEANLIRKGRPRKTLKTRPVSLLLAPMANAAEQLRREERDYLKSFEQDYLLYVEGILAALEFNEEVHFQNSATLMMEKVGSLEAWQKYKAKNPPDRRRLPNGTIDDFMKLWDIDSKYKRRLKMRFSRLKRR